MDPSDISSGEVSLQSTWMAFGRRAAVAVGASTALISLVAHPSLLEASVRGAVTWMATLALVRIGAWLMARTEPVAPEAEADGEVEAAMLTAENDR